jgi:phosphatidylglycerophosphate synthase
MASASTEQNPPLIVVGDNPTPVWGMSSATRIRRIAAASKVKPAGPMVVNDAFAFDPQWYAFIAERPGTVLTAGGVPVIANTKDPDGIVAALAGAAVPAGLATIAYESDVTIYNAALRKRERPFLIRLAPATLRDIERASYFGAYKGVTDILTKYLWPEWALILTRIAARLGLTPNMVTAIGAALCVWATLLFADGRYWAGMAAGLVFMVLDTVDGKLARCTITSSWWGNIFDHGIDLVHPPFWWFAWGYGLGAWGLALGGVQFTAVMAILVGGYVLQRLIEGYFIHRVGMHIHVWQKIDTDFRLITARRNPNMVILFLSVLAQRPDVGLVAITAWTIISLLFHFVRLLQAVARRRRGETLLSWLADEAAA